VIITVSGGGSGIGIASMIQHAADIGMASRHVGAEEVAKLNGKVEDLPSPEMRLQSWYPKPCWAMPMLAEQGALVISGPNK